MKLSDLPPGVSVFDEHINPKDTDEPGRVFQVYGERFYFCGVGCRDAFKADRQHRLIYPPETAQRSRKLEVCAYCGA